MKNISQSKIKSFLLKSTVFRASLWNILFHDRLLTVFLLWEERGRPSDLHVFTVNRYLSIFANYLTSSRKREKYGWKISRKVKSKVFLLKSTVFRAPHWNHLFHDGLLRVFLWWEDRGKSLDLHVITVNPYLSIFANYLTSYKEREKYGWKISRKVKLKVFCSNPRSSWLPMVIFCFMMGF